MNSNTHDGYHSLKEYIKLKQKKYSDVIFYSTAPSKLAAADNPYIFPLNKHGIPVLIANTHLEEVIFHEIGVY
jgi:HSP90 family molecular chaperone